MSERESVTDAPRAPRVVFAGLASCFGCQINITNIEEHLLAVLGQIDLAYWQLTSSAPMPDEFDVAVVEGAVTTEEAASDRLLKASAVTAMEAVMMPASSLPPKSSRFRAMPMPPESTPHRRRTSGLWGSSPPRQKRRKKFTNDTHLSFRTGIHLRLRIQVHVIRK